MQIRQDPPEFKNCCFYYTKDMEQKYFPQNSMVFPSKSCCAHPSLETIAFTTFSETILFCSFAPLPLRDHMLPSNTLFCPQHGFATSIVVGIHNRCSLAAGGAWGPRIVWVLQHLLLSTRAARWNMYVEKSRKSIFIQTSQGIIVFARAQCFSDQHLPIFCHCHAFRIHGETQGRITR